MINLKKDPITPEKLYFSRRKFLALVGSVGLSAALAACGVLPTPSGFAPSATSEPDTLTPYDTITHYNNFYEFSLQKEDVADLATGMEVHFETNSNYSRNITGCGPGAGGLQSASYR